MSHKTTPISASRITDDDRISIELVRPDFREAFVRIVWPTNAATVIDPSQFPATASAVAQLFARAHVVLASLKAGGEL